MPILGVRLFEEFDEMRTICIGGGLSAGKTRLAFDIALPYWRRGYRIFSNVPHNFSHWMGDNDFALFRSLCIFDEGGEYVRDQKTASMLTRSEGKADYYSIFCGKRMPHKNLQDVVIKPRFNFYMNYGVPLILWHVKVNADDAYKFGFFQYLPQKMHGTYSTLTSSGGIEKILLRAEFTVKRLAEMEGQIAGVQADAGVTGLAEDFASGIASLS